MVGALLASPPTNQTKVLMPTSNSSQPAAPFSPAETTRESILQTAGRLKIILMVGQPNAGKSFLAQVLTDCAGLLDREDVLLADGEEGSNLVFTRLAGMRIQPIKLETQQDVETLITRMEKSGFTTALVDTKGGSLEAIRRACGNFEDITDSQVDVVACVIVGSRENAEIVGLDWLDILKPLKRIYWVWNNQRHDQKDERTLREDLPCEKEKVTEIHISALRDDIAREIITLGARMSDVEAGQVTESTLLSHRMVKPAVGRWLKLNTSSLSPIISEF